MTTAPTHFVVERVRDKTLPLFSRLLQTVAKDLEDRSQPLWTQASLGPGALTEAYPDANMYMARQSNNAIGGMVIVEDDPRFWPDIQTGESMFVHKLAVLPSAQGSGVASRLLTFAQQEARAQGKRYLCLDCAAERPRLRSFYEREGFVFAEEHTVGTFFAAFYEQELT